MVRRAGPTYARSAVLLRQTSRHGQRPVLHLGRSRQTDGAAGGGARQGQQHPHAPGCLTRKPRGSGREGLPFDAEHPPSSAPISGVCHPPTLPAAIAIGGAAKTGSLPQSAVAPSDTAHHGWHPLTRPLHRRTAHEANAGADRASDTWHGVNAAFHQCALSYGAATQPMHEQHQQSAIQTKTGPVQYRTVHTTMASLVCLCPCAAATQSTCLVISKDPWMLGGLASHAARRRGLLPAPSEEHMMGGR